eukprot:3818327-Rhodomonas_salina.7
MQARNQCLRCYAVSGTDIARTAVDAEPRDRVPVPLLGPRSPNTVPSYRISQIYLQSVSTASGICAYSPFVPHFSYLPTVRPYRASHTCLRQCYAMSGTDVVYGATSADVLHATTSTDAVLMYCIVLPGEGPYSPPGVIFNYFGSMGYCLPVLT